MGLEGARQDTRHSRLVILVHNIIILMIYFRARGFSTPSRLKEALAILGLSRATGLSREMIKSAYREKALKYHPDILQTEA